MCIQTYHPNTNKGVKSLEEMAAFVLMAQSIRAVNVNDQRWGFRG
ncbi:MAG: hypothetical protein ACJAZM_000576 [Cyclobacteriaceae bacterium]|jgi:hypothetical protein